MEEVGDREVIVIQEDLLFGGEQPFPDSQACPRHRRSIVLHVEFVREFVGRQLSHCRADREGSELSAPGVQHLAQ